MGRTAAVNYEQVGAMAQQLQAEGLTPTAKLIRYRLGDVGSLGTIQKHLVDWRSNQGGVQPVVRMLPPEVQRAVFKFVDEEVSRINDELRQQAEQAERATADLAADNDEQTNLVSQLRDELAEQATLRAKQDGQLTRLLDELKTAHEETARARHEAELARQDLAKIQSRLEAQAPLESELRQLRTEFEAQRDARVRAERDMAVLKAQKDHLEARIAELKEAASTSVHVNRASGEDRAGKKPVRAPLASAHRGKKAKGSIEPSMLEPEHASNSAVSEPGEPVDPRQAKLC
jgi:hypothetical protein